MFSYRLDKVMDNSQKDHNFYKCPMGCKKENSNLRERSLFMGGWAGANKGGGGHKLQCKPSEGGKISVHKHLKANLLLTRQVYFHMKT